MERYEIMVGESAWMEEDGRKWRKEGTGERKKEKMPRKSIPREKRGAIYSVRCSLVGAVLVDGYTLRGRGKMAKGRGEYGEDGRRWREERR